MEITVPRSTRRARPGIGARKRAHFGRSGRSRVGCSDVGRRRFRRLVGRIGPAHGDSVALTLAPTHGYRTAYARRLCGASEPNLHTHAHTTRESRRRRRSERPAARRGASVAAHSRSLSRSHTHTPTHAQCTYARVCVCECCAIDGRRMCGCM